LINFLHQQSGKTNLWNWCFLNWRKPKVIKGLEIGYLAFVDGAAGTALHEAGYLKTTS
jgi:hypothetical protein